MTEFQRLFLVQARTDFRVFEILRKDADLPACHALHYLQMATEMLGKAYAWKKGPRTNTHRAFVILIRDLRKNREAQKQLGFKGKNTSWEYWISKKVPLAESIENLAPALSPDGPNPEYPWPRLAPQFAPAEYAFQVWDSLGSQDGRQFLNLVGRLFSVAEVFLD